MVGVAARYGETGASPYLLPLSVDGLVIVASVSLVELAGRVRALEAPVADGRTAAVMAPVDGRTAATVARVTEPVTPAVDDADGWPPLVPVDGPEVRRTDAAPADGRVGRRPATVADAIAVANGQTNISRDALARRLRGRGLSAANDRLPALLDAVRASGRTPASPADGRTPARTAA